MSGQDQIIDEAMARSIQSDAARTHPLLTPTPKALVCSRPIQAWVVTHDEGTYRGRFVGRLVTKAPTVLLADTLGELHAQLPPGTRWSDRQPADPPEVVEVWF